MLHPSATLPDRTYLVFTGTQGGGMIFGNEFRVSETAASRHWGMMGFDTLNRAIEGQLVTARQKDEGNDYLVEVKFNPQDTLRYWINMRTFLIDKISTRYNSQVLIEEERSDYRRAECMMLPFRIMTRLQGQRFSDLAIESYDLKAEFSLPPSRSRFLHNPAPSNVFRGNVYQSGLGLESDLRSGKPIRKGTREARGRASLLTRASAYRPRWGEA